MKIFISAGEASGDALGAHLIDALRARQPDPKVSEFFEFFEFFGMGGQMMCAREFRAVRDSNELGVVGLVEVLRHLPRLLGLLDDLATRAIDERPDVAVLIDAPDFNIRLAKKLKRAGIPVVFYVGPSVWAWRSGRARRYRPHIDRLLVLFPFEVPIWQAAGVDVVCVGHPLVDEIPTARAPEEGDARTIALLPGSRGSEINRHLSTLLEAAVLIRERGIADRFILPVAPTVDPKALTAQIDASAARGAVSLVTTGAGDAGPRRDALAASSLALVASGTATLETALVGRPQVIFYRVSWLTWLLFKPFVRVAWLGLANLIAGREIAPELLQSRFSATELADAAARLMGDSEARADALRGVAEVRAKLGDQGAADRAAVAVLEVARRGLASEAPT